MTVAGNIDDWFAARATAALHAHDGSYELELEEAFVDTRALPRGLSLRAGRFLSQIGYLNEQHLHADDFVDRSLPYRAFLGGHYFDTGLRANWVAPTALYLRLGVEAFDGSCLVESAARERTVGAWALTARTGGDIGLSQSWQAGFAYLRNRLEGSADVGVDHEHAGGTDSSHDNDHGPGHSRGSATVVVSRTRAMRSSCNTS